LTAVMFLTRIRVPDHISHSDEYLQKAPKYFPVIGWMVGGISALVFLVFDRLVSTDVGLLASVIAGSPAPFMKMDLPIAVMRSAAGGQRKKYLPS